MSTQPEPAQEPRWQARPETTPRDALIGMYAINEGDVALLDEIVDAITAAARAEVARQVRPILLASILNNGIPHVGHNQLCHEADAKIIESALEDAAPRQPEPETAPHYWIGNRGVATGGNAAAPDTTTGTTDE